MTHFSTSKGAIKRMQCHNCGQETFMPFKCPYCGEHFCSAHRLPENHACPKIMLAQAQKQQSVAEAVAPKYNSYQYSVTFGQPLKSRGRIFFSPKEVKHVAVAALLVVAIGFSIGLYGNYFGGFSFVWTWYLMAVFSALMTLSFLAHELAHKVIAQKKGLWAEFRLTKWGALLTLASVFLPFRMIAPGAMMISGSPNGDEIVKISLAGPITNIAFSTGLLGVAFAVFPSSFAFPLFFASYINAFFAVFNLIPFGVLDGFKIFSWNKKVWVLAFSASVALTVATYLFAFY